VLTDRRDLYDRAQFLRDHGRLPGDTMFRNAEVAHKYKMSAMQAALGTAQLERVEELIVRKRQIFDWYRQRLAEVPGLTLNAEPAGTRNGYWMVTVLWDPALNLEKKTLQLELETAGVDTRPFFHPLSSLPAYRHHPTAASARTRNPVAYHVAARGLNLPSARNLTEDQVDHVCRVLRQKLAAPRTAA